MSSSVMARPAYMPKYVPQPGCVLYLEGQQDAKSALIKDKSGFANHGAITGATWVRLPSGLWVNSFDGTDDVINCGNSSILNFTSGNFTVTFWIKTTQTQGHIMGRGRYFSEGWDIAFIASKLYFFTNQAAGYTFLTSNTAPNSCIWEFWCCVRNGANGFIYKNGIQDVTGALSDAITSTKDFKIGIGEDWRWGGVDKFAGSNTLTTIFNIGFSATQIKGIYQRERHLFGV
jgi:hypothetical protein